MKQIKLKDGVTLMAVEPADKNESGWVIEGKDIPAFFNQLDNALNLEPSKDKHIVLGTAPELLAREDAEEVCAGWVALMHLDAVIMSMPMGYKIYCGSEGITDSAKASFQSALDVMGYNGEILIIKVTTNEPSKHS